MSYASKSLALLLAGFGLAAGAASAAAQSTSVAGAPGANRRVVLPIGSPSTDIVEAGSIDLTGQPNCGAPPRPWSAAYTPDGRDLYVSLFGGFLGSGGCQVLRLDAQTGATLASIPVGESPEDIALRLDNQGNLIHGFVTCSSESRVDVFNAQDQIVATIPLPPQVGGSFPTTFPFGIVLDEARQTAWVGTNDSSGRLFGIDLSSLTLDPARTIQLGLERGVSRFALHKGELIVPTFRFTPSFTGSIAELVIVDPDRGRAHDVLLLAQADSIGVFPAPQEVVVTPDGRALVAGFDMGPRIYVTHLPSRTALGTFPTQTSQPLGKFQCMALSDDGLLIVADFFTNEISRMSAFDGTVLGITDAADLANFHGSFTAALLSPDQAELLLVGTGSNSLALFALQ